VGVLDATASSTPHHTTHTHTHTLTHTHTHNGSKVKLCARN